MKRILSVILTIFIIISSVQSVFALELSKTLKTQTNKTLTVGDIPIGSILMEEESNWEFRDSDNYRGNIYKTAPIQWKLISNDAFGKGKSLLVTDEAIAKYKFDPTSNSWQNSDLREWLRDGFYNKLSSKLKGIIEITETVTEGRTLNNETVFVLSLKELGIDSTNEAEENGSKISYFDSDKKRILEIRKTDSKTAVDYWTRSAYSGVMSKAVSIDQVGKESLDSVKTSTLGIRAAINITSSTTVGGPYTKDGLIYYKLFGTENLSGNTAIEKHSDELKPAEKLKPVPIAKPKATFKGVNYKFKSNVEEISSETVSEVAKVYKNGRIDRESLKTLTKKTGEAFTDAKGTIERNKIFVSKEENTAFKLAAEAGSQEAGIEDIPVSDVFEEYNIPEQKVFLTAGNIDLEQSDFKKVQDDVSGSVLNEGIKIEESNVVSYAAQNSGSTSQTPGNIPLPPGISMGNSTLTKLVLDIDNYRLKKSVDGIAIDLTVDGNITLTAPHIDGYYYWNDGYKLVFKAGESIDLHVKSGLEIHKEYSFLLAGIDIPAEIGSVKAGLYLKVAADGQIFMVLDFNQGFSVEAGIKGGTFWGVPTSINKVAKVEAYCNADINIGGEIKTSIAIGPVLSLELLGKNILTIEAWAGIGIESKMYASLASTADSPPNDYLKQNVELFITASGKAFSKKKTFLDKHISLFEKQAEYTGSYNVAVLEACAYRSQVKGTVTQNIFKANGEADVKNYEGKVQVRVLGDDGKLRTKDGQAQIYEGTMNNGKFTITNLPLAKGEAVQLKIPGTANSWTNPVYSTIPFRDVKLTVADYFNNYAEGYVGSKYDEDEGEVFYNGDVKLRIKREGLADAVVYAGKVENGEFYSVKGVNGVGNDLTYIKKNNLVSAFIEVNGFTVESSSIEADGIEVSDMLHDNFRIEYGADGKEYYKADKSFVIVSNIRAEKFPQNKPAGSIDMIAGVDLPHRIPENAAKKNYTPYYTEYASANALWEIDVFSKLENPLMYFGMRAANGKYFSTQPVNVTLVKSPKADGTSYGIINAWSVSTDRNTKVSIDDIKGDRHNFFFISYRIPGVDGGTILKQYLEAHCSLCNEEFGNKAKEASAEIEGSAFQSIDKVWNYTPGKNMLDLNDYVNNSIINEMDTGNVTNGGGLNIQIKK